MRALLQPRGGPRCRICEDARRDADVICVVEEPSDVIPIERTNEFRGRYHVLGGALSPIDGIDPEDLHIGELLERASSNGVREVVVATNATTTGEATALYIADALRERAPAVTVTRLASGLPVGADLEYADEVTLGTALARPPRPVARATAHSGSPVVPLRPTDPRRGPRPAARRADLAPCAPPAARATWRPAGRPAGRRRRACRRRPSAPHGRVGHGARAP